MLPALSGERKSPSPDQYKRGFWAERARTLALLDACVYAEEHDVSPLWLMGDRMGFYQLDVSAAVHTIAQAWMPTFTPFENTALATSYWG